MDEVEREILAKMWALRERLRNDPNAPPIEWIIAGRLAAAQRPLRDHPTYGGRTPLSPDAKPLVVQWVERVQAAGIRSVISLLEVAQHERYYGARLGLQEHGLFGYLAGRGLDVVHYPLTDYQRPSDASMSRIGDEYDRLPKPVLIFCSAAIDRTTPVAAFIVRLERPAGGAASS
jgi:hypothetical protein